MEITCQPQRAIADLRALAELTGGPGGARRLAWTDEWASARRLLREWLADLPVHVEIDEAGNLWARLAGDRPEAVVIGSHIDSVPNGGWLDGALGVMAALETLRTIAAAGAPP
jgi:N-carbamoyl-L-amino-acid hydrolase